MGVFGILREILKFPFRNGKLVLSTALLLLILSSLMFIGNNLKHKPSIMHLFQKAYILGTNNLSGPEYIKLPAEMSQDIPSSINEEAIFTTVVFGLSVLSMIATIFTSAVTYYDEKLPVRDVLRKILTVRWLCLIISALLMASIAVPVVMAKGPGRWVSLGFLIALLGFISSLYLIVVSIMGYAISVLIQGCYELGVLGKAGELLRGKMLQRFVHSLLLTVVAMAMSGILGFEIGPAWDIILIIVMNISCLVTLSVSAVYTVVYHECQKSEQGNVEIECGNGYSLVSPTTLLVDDSLP